MDRNASNLLAFPERPETQTGERALKTLAARILRAGYIAEIIRDDFGPEPIFHWVVQQCESGEVLALGQARTLAEAEHSAVAFLDDLRLRRAI